MAPSTVSAQVTTPLGFRREVVGFHTSFSKKAILPYSINLYPIEFVLRTFA